ncbi:hypothetical protein JXL19_01535 [bacterium]|nr:hypothetical protein [bacterium]
MSNIKVPALLSWLFPYKDKDLPVSIKSPLAYYLIQNKITLIIINWVFQGILGMDKTEILFHLGYDLVWAIIFFGLLANLIGWWTAMFFSIILAHTLNWLLNSHFWVMGRYIGISRVSTEKIYSYLERFYDNFSENRALLGAVVLGNMRRGGSIKTTSDLDLRVIRKRGLLNAILSNLILAGLKTSAFLKRFPLDIYLLDDVIGLSRYRLDESPLILFDRGGDIRGFYASRNQCFDLMNNERSMPESKKERHEK